MPAVVFSGIIHGAYEQCTSHTGTRVVPVHVFLSKTETCSSLLERKGSDNCKRIVSLRVARVSSPPSTVTDSRTSPICMEKVKMPVRAPFSSAMARSTSALHSPDDGLSTSRRDASQQVTLFPVFVT